MLTFRPWKLELFIAGILVSTAVMDSPVWGIARISHGLPLWHADASGSHVPTSDISEWIVYYYNPVGSYLVWDSPWLFPEFPSAAAIFWSVFARFAAAAVIIGWQYRKEHKDNREYSLSEVISRNLALRR